MTDLPTAPTLSLGHDAARNSGAAISKPRRDARQCERVNLLIASRTDPAAFEKLYAEQEPRVRGYLRRRARPADVDDLVQQVFLEAWKSRHRYRGDAVAATFLNQIARHMLGKALGQIPASKTVLVNESEVDLKSDPKLIAERREAVAAVDQALMQLSVKQRQAIELTYRQGLTTAEAATVAGCTLKAMRIRHRDAYDKLKRLLGQ